jgi:hypothetical protein
MTINACNRLCFSLGLLLLASAAFAAPIDDSDKYAWSENTGWRNWNSDLGAIPGRDVEQGIAELGHKGLKRLVQRIDQVVEARRRASSLLTMVEHQREMGGRVLALGMLVVAVQLAAIRHSSTYHLTNQRIKHCCAEKQCEP